MAEITTHRVERKPPRPSTTRLLTHEDAKDAPEGVEVVKASDFEPTKKPKADAPRASRFAPKSEE